MWLVLTDWVSDQLILMQFSWVFWFILFVCLLGNHISMMLQVRVHGRFDLLQTKPYPWKYTGMCMRFSSLSLSLTLACRSGVFVKFMQYFFKIASRFLEQNPSDLIEIYADSWILPHLYQANCVLSSCALKAYIFHVCVYENSCWKFVLCFSVWSLWSMHVQGQQKDLNNLGFIALCFFSNCYTFIYCWCSHP